MSHRTRSITSLVLFVTAFAQAGELPTARPDAGRYFWGGFYSTNSCIEPRNDLLAVIFASGGNTSGQILNLAARHKDGRWIIAYLGGKAEFSINLDKLISEGQLSGFWIDPRDGKQKPIGTLQATGAPTFSTPEGWEDALLVLE
jgi:hypothetical protein